MKFLMLFIYLLIFLIPAQADYHEGLRAYDNGDYSRAFNKRK